MRNGGKTFVEIFSWRSTSGSGNAARRRLRRNSKSLVSSRTASRRSSCCFRLKGSSAFKAICWKLGYAPLSSARETLLNELKRDALVIGEVTLASGRQAEYYVDTRRALLRPVGFLACGELIAEQASQWGAQAVGGMSLGADPIACAALAVPAGRGLSAFFVRKERKEHGLQRWVEGPLLESGTRCLIVEDVITSGGSTVAAIERVQSEGLEIVGVLSVLDRLAGGADAVAAVCDAPYHSLFTIDEVYPERPD